MPGRPTIWISVGQGPTALAVGAGGGWTFPFSPLSPSLLVQSNCGGNLKQIATKAFLQL